MKNCTKCGAQLGDGDKFCYNCGTAQEEATMYCRNCGCANSSGDSVCKGCGAPLYGMPPVPGVPTVYPAVSNAPIHEPIDAPEVGAVRYYGNRTASKVFRWIFFGFMILSFLSLCYFSMSTVVYKSYFNSYPTSSYEYNSYTGQYEYMNKVEYTESIRDYLEICHGYDFNTYGPYTYAYDDYIDEVAIGIVVSFVFFSIFLTLFIIFQVRARKAGKIIT